MLPSSSQLTLRACALTSGLLWLEQIATGKSTTLELLKREAGAVVLNADQFGHEAYLPGTKCQQQLVAHFGAKILAADGTVDRKVL